MTYLPSPDAMGMCEHPFRQVKLNTTLGVCHCGCDQPTVYHEDGTVCLTQTVKVRNNLSVLQVLSQSRFLHPFAAYIQKARLDPQEFFLVRNELDLETWSLVFGLAPPQVIALCYMAVYDRPRFEALGLLDLHDQTLPPYSTEFINRLDKTASEYLATLPGKFFSQAHWKKIVKPMSSWSPLQLLHVGVKSNSELGNFFTYTQQFGHEGLTLALSIMDPLSVSLLHMARFSPDSYSGLIKSMGEVPDPEVVRDNSIELSEKELKLELSLAEYMVVQLNRLSTYELEPEQYTDDDWLDLFDL